MKRFTILIRNMEKSTISMVIMCILLLLLGALLTIIYSSYGAISVLSYPPNSNNDYMQSHKNEIIKGEVIKGQFMARENNLGIVLVRFYNFEKISDDSLTFSIKEKGQQKWFYEQNYKVNQFQPDKFFTFGFPLISDSKGKTYEFQLKSLYGKKGNGIGISTISPTFITQYQFTKNELLNNKFLLINHLVKKFINAFMGTDFKISSIIYFLPFISFVTLNICLKKILSSSAKNKKYFYGLSTVFLIFNIILIFCNILFVRQLSSNIAVIILLVVWLWISFTYHFDSSITFLFAFIFLFFCPIMVAFNSEEIAQRTAIWTYYFLCTGIIQQLVQSKLQKKMLLNYKDVSQKFFRRL